MMENISVFKKRECEKNPKIKRVKSNFKNVLLETAFFA